MADCREIEQHLAPYVDGDGIADRTAVEAHVLVPDRTGEAYRSRHALVRDVVYEDTLPAERRHLHARIARAMTERPGRRPADTAPGLAGDGAARAADGAWRLWMVAPRRVLARVFFCF